jgi:capsid protein
MNAKMPRYTTEIIGGLTTKADRFNEFPGKEIEWVASIDKSAQLSVLMESVLQGLVAELDKSFRLVSSEYVIVET